MTEYPRVRVTYSGGGGAPGVVEYDHIDDARGDIAEATRYGRQAHIEPILPLKETRDE